MKLFLLSLVVAIAGLAIYLLIKPLELRDRVSEAARLAWAVGLLAFLLQAPQLIKIFTG
jgi:hypothetical protein